MRWEKVARNVGNFAVDFGAGLGRIVGNTFIGIMFGVGITLSLGGILTGIGIIVDLVFRALNISAVHPLGFTFFIFFCAMMAASLIFLILGRFLSEKPESPDEQDAKIEILFIGYGIFSTMFVFMTFFYYNYDHSIFSEQNVSFWNIVRYGYSVTLLGFIPDVIQYEPIALNLTAVGRMKFIQFCVKVLMAATTISGGYQYLKVRYNITLNPF